MLLIMDNVFASYDYENIYRCSKITSSRHFTKLMYLVINNKKYGNDILRKYILENKEEINKKNNIGWTALMIAARNSNVDNNVETVKLQVVMVGRH
jgi:ankyrin repeat protein